MNKVGRNLFDIGYMDALASGDSPIHRLDPRALLITTLMFIVTVVSFDRHAVSALVPLMVFPVALIAAGGLPAGYLMKKVFLLSPFAVMVGIFNPLMDQGLLYHFGPMAISSGWVSFASILLKFFLTVTSALVLISLAGFNALCESMLALGIPKPFVVQLYFSYRYMFVLGAEAERTVRARSLRVFSDRPMGVKVFGSIVGNLLLRTMDRAERIYRAMCCRGFDGHIPMIRSQHFIPRDILFMLVWGSIFVSFRCVDVPVVLGDFLTRILS